MGHAVSGGGKPQIPLYKTHGEKLTKALVVEEIKIIEVPREIVVPVMVEKKVEQTRYVTVQKDQIKYNTVVKDTVKYVPKEEVTTRYVPRNEETVKYITREMVVEKPVPVDKPYERPVIREREYEIATIKDMANVRELMVIVPKLVDEIDKLRNQLVGLTNYKLVEKVVEAPVIQWVNTAVERIIWKDVVREKPNADKGR